MADLDDELNNARNLREELDEILFLQRSFTDEALKAAKAVGVGNENARNISKAFRGVSNATADLNTSLRQALKGEVSLSELGKKIESSRKRATAIETNLALLKKDGIDFSEKEMSLLERKKEIDEIINNSKGQLTEEEEYLLGLYSDQLETLAAQESAYQKIEKLDKGMGIFKDLGDGAKNLLDQFGGRGLSNALGFSEAQKEVEKYVLSLDEGADPNKFKIAGKYVTTLGKNLLKSLGPLALITSFVKGLLDANKQTVGLQKSMLLTSKGAVDFRQNLATAANLSANINVTSTKLLETFNSINDQFGFIARFSEETLVNTTRLTEQVGLSAEAANALAGLTEIQGVNAENLYESVVGTTLELQKQSGVQIDQRKILEEIGKVTGSVRANLGSNPIEIAKAIQKAREFGTTLEQVAATTESLLNFESSIEAELQAELLLGKNINLERARAAALAGDQVTLAEELRKEAGSFAEFSAMNVIQQNALAEALGMNKDQLADTLYQQELQLKGAERVRAELAATGQDEAVRALDAQTAQDKFAKTMEKLQSIVVDVATAFMPILEVVGSIASAIGHVIKVLSPMIGTISGALTGLIVSGGNPIGALIGGAVGAIGDIGRSDSISEGRRTQSRATRQTTEETTTVNNTTDMSETNQLLKTLVSQNDKKPEISPVGLYQVQ
jgi:biotin operon repressor